MPLTKLTTNQETKTVSKHPWLLKPIKAGLIIDAGGTPGIRVELKSRTIDRFGTKGFTTKIKKA